MTPEEHFEAIKLSTDQMAFDLGELQAEARGPWVKTCGNPGPYAMRAPTPKMPHRLQVLTCTRPEHHGTPFHIAADHYGVVLATWGRDGTPVFPPILKAST